MGNVVGRFLQQNADMTVVQVVEHMPAAPLANNKTQVAENPQLMRNSRLLHPDRLGQLAHRARALAKPGENKNATGRRKRLHRLRDLARGLNVDDTAAPSPPINTMAHRANLT